MDLASITTADFKAHFVRDFSYGATPDKVMDADINKALSEAKVTFNQSLFPSDDAVKIAFLYLTAHCLVIDFKNAKSGLGGGSAGILSARTVGSVSETYSIPERYLKSPIFGLFAKTGYGQKYLSFLIPNLVGNVGIVAGGVNP